MKSNFLLITILILLFSFTSCKAQNQEINNETNNKTDAEIEQEVIQEALNIIPFKERKFIYQNGLNFEYTQETLSESNKNIDKYYHQINGLINKEIETKINEHIENLINMEIIEVEKFINSLENNPNIDYISTNAHVNYSCNNVMFLDYSSSITYTTGALLENFHFTKSQGFDLNTGNTLNLKDLFKQDVDYNKILNDLIYMELINSNYDDPDSLFMKGPFQGIRENQSFSFNEDRLLIIMDEKNEEFNTSGYPVTISIPLKAIGNELAIFDRYFDEEINIFENKRIKKLMPNFAYYHIENAIQEYEEYYNICIELGKFVGIEDMETKKLLDKAVSNNLDIESFKERAKEYKSSHSIRHYGSLYHQVDVMMSNGGYISLLANSNKNELNMPEVYQKYINFDLNNNKIMTLNDLFIDGYDYKTELIEILNKNKSYPMHDNTFSKNEEILIAESDFYFSQNYVFLIFYQPGETVREAHIWIEYKDIGYENISIFQ